MKTAITSSLRTLKTEFRKKEQIGVTAEKEKFRNVVN